MEAFEGRIEIDGIDISTIGLKKLRSSITIIPQDPVLMKDTLRYNIDPLSQYSDEQIMAVIKLIKFESFVTNDELGLKRNV